MRLNSNYLISSFSPSTAFNSLLPLILLLIIFNDTNSSVFPNRLLSDNLILKAQMRFKRDFQLPLQQNESPNIDIPRSKRGYFGGGVMAQKARIGTEVGYVCGKRDNKKLNRMER
uniref:Uncharacterized protein n=1 Tax=Meloidogyne enterolobii TaxID=390850 RepID=A0A6V7VLB8_MELEN|nr:unnamed protein product [Meloidogyne enterolobii]